MLQISSCVAKHVRWAQDDSYFLIEERRELGSGSQYWYKKSDFVQFRIEAMQEIRDYMEKTAIQRVDEALSKLYQPEDA